LVTLDSSALLAALDAGDRHHSSIVTAINAEHGALIVPVGIMSEVAYFVERDLGQRALAGLMEDILSGAYSLDYLDSSWPRVLELIRRYEDLPLGLADAAVIECAERHGRRVLTLDRRHFGVVEREGSIRVLP
jgi:predicted nucleic acid-binding protein